MTKLLMAVLLAPFIAAEPALAGAQKMAPIKPTTVTGCVAQSDAVFRLDQAIVGTDTDVDAQSRPSTESSPTPKTVSYIVVGFDLKPHLGHKVEVTGKISSEKTSKGTAGIKAAAGMTLAGTLIVESVKMVSATCP